jgi:hypothetical protein
MVDIKSGTHDWESNLQSSWTEFAALAMSNKARFNLGQLSRRFIFLQRMYPSILSFETINKLKLFIECGNPRPQDVGHLRLRYCNFLTHFYI